MVERLTGRNERGKAFLTAVSWPISSVSATMTAEAIDVLFGNSVVNEAIERLAEYEDAEERRRAEHEKII